MSSLKANITLNFINTITGIIFPVITFPYAARVLLPEGIGVVNFFQSIITYIVLLTSLGIPMYAVREVAKYRDDVEKRNRVTIEITLLSLTLCIFGYVAVWILGEFVPQINSQLSLFYVLSLTIFFTALGINWFYQAIEDFEFITIRALIFRTLVVISLFMFVKTKDDLLVYAFVMVGSTVGNNFINFIHLRKYITLKQINWRKLTVWTHLKPALRIFVYNVITSIYLILNTVMLGFMEGDSAVGFYTAGNRLSHIVLSVVASLGIVMLPRCSNLVEMGRTEDFSAITHKSWRFVIALALPSTIGLMLLATPIIYVFCGKEFFAASSVLCWTAPVIIFIGLSNVLGIQILYPQGKENLVIWSTVGGAFFNFVLNCLLIPIYSYTGAAISTFIAELVVLTIQIILGRKYIPFPIFERIYLNYLLASLLMSVAVLFLLFSITNIGIMLSVAAVTGFIIYAVTLWVMKDSLLQETMNYICKLLRR